MNFKKLWGGTVAAAVMLSSSVLHTQSNSFADVSSVESEVQTSSYWYPNEMEIAKQEICKQFNEDYTAVPDLLERYSAYCKINGSEKRKYLNYGLKKTEIAILSLLIQQKVMIQPKYIFIMTPIKLRIFKNCILSQTARIFQK